MFSDDALVVLGHGTGLNENSAAPVFQHAAELRRRRIFAEVREAFWKQEPQVRRVLEEISASRIFIVPLFVSEGYFASQVIPRELGFAAVPSSIRRPSACLFYCAPVGSHKCMADVILARAKEVVEQFPFPRIPKPADVSLFVAGHGTEKHRGSRRSIEQQVEMIRARTIYAAVHAIYLEENPRIAEAYALSQTKNMVVVPFFISDGLHTQEDIPVLLGESKWTIEQRMAAGQPAWRNPTEKNGRRLWYSSAVGTEPHIADVILERVREAARLF
ncbi:MAG TPA: CbiX/SirB N-terminal domain-containing protein [Verrucomicrobiae bacterium]|nr:CbiX/SirB N-terminal domain-containing protein [Verrucomicrobiae bacterium]